MQTFYLDKSEDFGAEFGNSCYLVYLHRLHLFWVTSLFLVFVCVSNSVVREKERSIWLILFAAKEKIFSFGLL